MISDPVKSHLYPTKPQCLLIVRLGDFPLPRFITKMVLKSNEMVPLPKWFHYVFSFITESNQKFCEMVLKMSQTCLLQQELVLEPAPKEFDEVWRFEEKNSQNTGI